MITQFMLTKNDVTIPDALKVYSDFASQMTADELSYVGFKNVGLPIEELEKLGCQIRDDGRKVVVEIVGGTPPQGEVEAAILAKRVGAACLIGGEHVEAVLEVIGPSPVKYYPAVGDITKEAGRLHGSIDEIVAHAKRYEALGVDGTMLLAYRFVGNVAEMMAAVRAAVGFDIVAAGSVDSRARIRQLIENGVWAYTIGSAVLDGQMTEEKGLRAQLQYVLRIASEEAAAAKAA